MSAPPKEIKVGFKRHLPQTCGVGEIGWFRYAGDEVPATAPNIQNIKIDKEVAGCGWIICSFTGALPVYKEAYDQLVERFGEPILQSEKRTNLRTNKKFFFCIFDTKDKP